MGIPSCDRLSEAHIESRQFIGWWREIPPPTSYMFDIAPSSHHLIPQIFLFRSVCFCSFYGPIISDKVLICDFSRGCLAPSPEARDAASIGLEDILYTKSLDILPPSGQEAQSSPAYIELVEFLVRATEKLSLDWSNEPSESQSSTLDERFLSGSGPRPTRRKLPFFPDLHYEVSRSWKQPFSSRLTNTADFTNLVGSVEQG